MTALARPVDDATKGPMPPGTSTPEPPAWLVPAALLFWGLHTGLWWLAAPLALLVVLPQWRGRRFELTLSERRRVADLCTLMIVLAGAWLVLNQSRLGGALVLLIQWLPGLLFPLLAVQLYGHRPGLELSVLFPSLRRGAHRRLHQTDALVDLRWAYVLLCVLAASMIPPQTAWFLPSLAILAAAALWRWTPTLPRRGPVLAAAMVVILVLSLALSAGIRWGHAEAERRVLDWMEQWLGVGLDPYRATTAIGEVGRLKASGRIMLRVYPPAPIHGTLLLRTASYDRYVDGTWFTTGSLFEPVPDQDGRRPLLPLQTPAAAESEPIGPRIVMLLRRAEGLLPLPRGTGVVLGLPGEDLHRNGYGTLRYRTSGAAPLLNYRVLPAPEPTRDAFTAPPAEADLRVLGPDAPAARALAESLALAELPPAEALRALRRHFARNFRYTLTLPEHPPGVGPLTHFLTAGHAGHCEYFATAAVLTLRAAGIPARYVRGWSVQEYSALEDAWVARDSHAHAWVEAHVDGRWRDLDPTPPDWAVLEAAGRPWSQRIGDFFAWLRLSMSGAADDERRDRDWLLLPLAALVLLLGWRIVRRARRGGGTADARTAPRRPRPPTPFTELERAAAKYGHARGADETLLEWARRLHGEAVPAAPALADAIAIHYRHRFDPDSADDGAEPELRRRLAECRRHWR
jgi:hypothetical protein